MVDHSRFAVSFDGAHYRLNLEPHPPQIAVEAAECYVIVVPCRQVIQRGESYGGEPQRDTGTERTGVAVGVFLLEVLHHL